MIKLYDSNNALVEITIEDERGLSWEREFFDVCDLDINHTVDAYIVNNVDDYIKQAKSLVRRCSENKVTYQLMDVVTTLVPASERIILGREV